MYDVYIKGDNKEIRKQIENLRELKVLVESFKRTDEVRIKKLEKK